jgi:hypothetical protein
VDEAVAYADDLRKRHAAQTQAMENYTECLDHANSWIQNKEKVVAAAVDQINWLSPQETRSRLLKLRSDQQEIAAFNRYVEIVNEKAAAVVQGNPLADTVEITSAVDKLNERYAELAQRAKASVSVLEESIEHVQQHQDLQKAYHDWQNGVWSRLTAFTDLSSGKATLEQNLLALEKLRAGLTEGSATIATMDKHMADMEGSAVPKKAQEALRRDLDDTRSVLVNYHI